MFKKLMAAVLAVLAISQMILLSSCGAFETKNPEKEEVKMPRPGTSEAIDEYGYNENYTKIAENENLIFYFNELSTDVKVKVKKTGFEWSTEYEEGSSKTQGEVFTLDYYETSGLVSTINSKLDSVVKGQFEYTLTDNGISVSYGVGDVDYSVRFPIALSVERYNNFSTLDTSGVIYSNYQYINFNDEQYKDLKTEDLNALYTSYPKAVNNPNGWYYFSGLTNSTAVNELNAAWDAINYTEEDLKIDNEGVTLPSTKSHEFAVTINYTLEENGLNVKIPANQIYYHEDYILKSINLHPNLMDFDEKNEGYYLLPDGSGSIMNFNNGKDQVRNDSVYIQMYGVDESRGATEKTAYYNEAILPVYGTCYKGKNVNAKALNKSKAVENHNGIFAIIEQGDTFAGITAHSSDKDEGEHNFLYSSFRINESENLEAFSNSTSEEQVFSKFPKQHYIGDIELTYYFLTGEDSSYSGMANFYSNYLFGEDKSQTKAYPATVETIGQINGNGLFFGIRYNTKETMTSFNEVTEIATDLQKNGIDELNVKLTGWFNGGYEHGWADKIQVANQLGGKKEFEAMLAALKAKGINVYPDADVQYVYAAEDSVSSKMYSSQISGRPTYVSGFDPVNFGPLNRLAKVALNMDSFVFNINGFMSNFAEFNHKNVSLRSIGSKINANYKEDNDFLDRQETLNGILKEIEKVDKDGYKIMGTLGYAPFAKYLDIINEFPADSANFDKTDYAVPFAAMVFSGHVEYTYKPQNLSNRERKDLLKMIESGSGSHFVLTANKYDKISETGYDFLYSTLYSDLKDDLTKDYSYVKNALSDVYGLAIVKHEQVAEDVNKVTYENGTSIYINYSNKDVKVSNLTIKSNDYLKVKGGQE